MTETHSVGRRRIFAGALAGGFVGVGSSAGAVESAKSGKSKSNGVVRLLAAKKVRGGDLILGPNATVVRVATKTRLAGGRVRLRYNDPATGASTPFDATSDRTGFPGGRKFVVLRRKVSLSSVQLTTTAPSPTPRSDLVIDGGTP